MAEIKNREDLQRWLKGKPVEVSRVIALRVAPLAARAFRAERKGWDKRRCHFNFRWRQLCRRGQSSGGDGDGFPFRHRPQAMKLGR